MYIAADHTLSPESRLEVKKGSPCVDWSTRPNDRAGQPRFIVNSHALTFWVLINPRTWTFACYAHSQVAKEKKPKTPTKSPAKTEPGKKGRSVHG